MNEKGRNILEKIKPAIRKKDPNAEVILFGSCARRAEHKESDWDILILVDKAKVDWEMENAYCDELFDVQLETGEAISTFVYSKKDWETRHSTTLLYEDVQNGGVVL